MRKIKIRTNLKRVSSLFLTLAMVASCLTACGEKGTEASSKDAVEQVATQEVVSPLDTDVTVTYWMELNGNVAASYNSIGETQFAKKLQEETGVTIEFQHAAVGQTAKAFNLLLAKTELPDVIEYSWLGYPGGPQKAIEDGVIIPLNDVIDQYCPNLKAYLEANPEIDKMVKTDDGTYYCFPFIRGGDKLLTSMGPMLRGDWLKELGLEVPTTIEEWETVLTAFKEEKGAAAPFSYQWSAGSYTNNNPFAYAYGVTREFYLDDNGQVVYGAVQDGYKDI